MVCSVAYMAGALTMVGSAVTLMYLRHHLPPPQASVWTATQIVTPSFISINSQPEMNILTNTDEDVQAKMEGNLPLDLRSDGRSNESENGATNDQENIDKNPAALSDLQQLSTGLHMPGFLTLVFLRDTVLQFVKATKEKYGHTRSEVHDVDSKQAEVVCSCGCCHGNVADRCFNVTDDDNHCNHRYCGNMNGRFWEMNTGLNCGQSQMEHSGVCGPDELCRCCCYINQRLSPWQPSVLTVLPPVHGIVLGFGTTAEAVS